MKKIILITGILLVALCCNTIAQINLFGVNISKFLEVEEDLIYRKLNCSKNPYYSMAEYKHFPSHNLKYILFDDFSAKHKTPQMKNPRVHIKELSNEISKTLGPSIRIYQNECLTNPIADQYFWVTKQGDKFLVAKLFYSNFSKRNNLRVFIFSSTQDLVKGFENLAKIENKQNIMYYDLARVLHKF